LRILPVGGPVWSLKIVKGQRKPHLQGWYSERYNRAEPAPCAVYTAKIEKTATFAWVLWPTSGPAGDIEATLADADKPVPTVLLKRPDGSTTKVTVPVGQGTPRLESVAADGAGAEK
jgi:hypothetical protein